MAKFRCVCGYVLSTSGEIPNSSEWLAVSDAQFDGYAGRVDAEELYRAFTHVFVCPQSGHLWVFKQGLANDPVGFAPLEPT
jgi:hypothetical protein